MYRVNKAKTIRCLLVVSSGTILLAGSSAFAQSTPAELADMALEDLLDFDVGPASGDGGSDDTKPRKWEFGYTYNKLDVGGYKTGTRNLTFDEVLFSPGETRTNQNYPVVPTFICQEVHAFSASYKLKRNLSVNVVVPYIAQASDHISSVPGFPEFTLKSKGIGDVGISAALAKPVDHSSSFHFQAGIRIPTGSIDKTGDTPRNGVGTLERLPYTMQIGSGTLDLNGAAAYTKRYDSFQLTAQAGTTIRTGKNDNDYRLGNNYSLSGTLQHKTNHWFQPGVNLNLRHIETIKGRDESLLVPVAFPFPASITDPDNYGGTKAHIAAVVDMCPNPDCSIKISGEYAEPIHQDLNGVQPKDDYYFSLSASAKF